MRMDRLRNTLCYTQVFLTQYNSTEIPSGLGSFSRINLLLGHKGNSIARSLGLSTNHGATPHDL